MSSFLAIFLRKVVGAFLLNLIFLSSAYTQDWDIDNVNGVYDQMIRTVKFHLDQLPTSQPIIDLNSSTRLRLTFDDMTGEQMEYYYTVYHCNADWENSDIEPLEYLTIYEEGEIRELYFSGTTQNPYVQYRQALPNNEINWRISGNYMLVVYYYDGDEKVPVISRRFMVSDNRYSIDARFYRPTVPGTIQTHHEMEVTVNVRKRRLKIPLQQVRLYVYQNGRWDRGVKDQTFNRFLQDEYYFDMPGQFVFPAAKEFRPFDNRFINSPGGQVAYFERNENGFLAMLHPDVPRDVAPYLTYFDLNGQYVIMDREANLVSREDYNVTASYIGDSISYEEQLSTRVVNLDPLCLNCEYVDVLFSLKVDQPYGDDVYIFGEITGWELDPLFKMEYDPTRKAYFAKIQLKQGYYDYQYALDTKEGINTQIIEGLSHEGENDYLMLVYDRHPFNRGDRLVGTRVINSSQ